MRGFGRIACLFFIFLTLQSCGMISAWVHGPAYAVKTSKTLKQTLEMVDSTGTKSIMLVPLVHVGAEEDYAKITYFIDGLKSNGYITLHEGMYIPESMDSVSFDITYRKYRRILGSFDMIRARHGLKEGWIPQSVEMVTNFMHLSTDKDFCADVSIVEFVEYFEQEYGREVPLNDYDMECPLSDLSYHQKLLPKSYWPMLKAVQFFRDDRLLDYVLANGHDKIAVIYGSYHTNSLKHILHSRYGYQYKYPKN